MKEWLRMVVQVCSAGSVVLVLAACGGGGGGASVTGAPATGTPQAVAPPTAQPTAPAEPVEPANRAPSISGSPARTATVANAYRFQAKASDADGDRLSYQITNKPVWAQFDVAAGRLEGTPDDAHVGTYSNIRVSVSDGTAIASLVPFTITVNALGEGNATLSWTPPTVNTDGSTLTDLGGYRIYYGRAPDELTRTLEVSAAVTTAVVENLAPGTWHFAMTAVNTGAIESLRSGQVSKTI